MLAKEWWMEIHVLKSQALSVFDRTEGAKA